MLASIIPGLREARIPLICGYVWLTTVWLFLEQVSFQPADALFPVYQDVSQFLGIFGSGVIVGLVSVMAYLVGTILQVDSQMGFVALVGGVAQPVKVKLEELAMQPAREALRSEWATQLAGGKQ
jgi:hypothetical protein